MDLAKDLSLNAFDYKIGYEIYDDHVPLWENAQIPAIDIIDFDYPNLFYNHWHTQNDVPENCSPQSLHQVGTLLLNYIYAKANNNFLIIFFIIVSCGGGGGGAPTDSDDINDNVDHMLSQML